MGDDLDKNILSESCVCTKLITQVIAAAGWDIQTLVREKATFTAGWVILGGKLVRLGQRKRSDYLLSEQYRIVARMDQHMVLCDRLESQLQQSQADGAKLMKAAVHHLSAA